MAGGGEATMRVVSAAPPSTRLADGALVLVDHVVDPEGVDLAGPEAIDGSATCPRSSASRASS
jgi:hypothetical protein